MSVYAYSSEQPVTRRDPLGRKSSNVGPTQGGEPCPPNGGDCCHAALEEAEKNKKPNELIFGVTVCCGGEKQVCIADPQPYPPASRGGKGADAARAAIAECTRAHECHHVANTESCEDVPDGVSPVSTDDNHDPAKIAGIKECAKKDCGQLAGRARTRCLEFIQSYINQTCSGLEGPRPVPPCGNEGGVYSGGVELGGGWTLGPMLGSSVIAPRSRGMKQ